MIESLRLVVSLYSLKCQCFTGETLVSTTEGDKRIDEIEVGDYVYAYDTETGENVASKVTYVSITETDILVHIYTSEGEEIKATMLHPFYVKNAKNGDEEYGIWKATANLVAGDELLTEEGRVVYVEEIKLERLEESIMIYNLEVEGLHDYYVGSGILVHNGCATESNSNQNSDKETELFLPDEYYQNLNKDIQNGYQTPNTREVYKRLGNTSHEVETSIVISDEIGRIKYRVDYSTHGNNLAHTDPHIHEFIPNLTKVNNYPSEIKYFYDINTEQMRKGIANNDGTYNWLE